MNTITVRELARELSVTIPSFYHGSAADWLVNLDQTLESGSITDDTELDADYADMIRENWVI